MKTSELFDHCFTVASTGCLNYQDGGCTIKPETTANQCALQHKEGCEWFEFHVLPLLGDELTKAYDAATEEVNEFFICQECGERLVQDDVVCPECREREAKAAAAAVQKEKGKLYHVFTDGACQGNPGPGGWGVVVKSQDGEYELSGGEPETTNNKMELTATIQALKSLPKGSRVELTTDSRYVQQGMRDWLPKWKRNGWKTSSKTPVKNADLWRELDTLSRKHKIEFRWVKGHSGHPENERCDELATGAIEMVA